MLQQQVVHLPEPALRTRRLGRLRRDLRPRVHVGQRQMAPHIPKVVVVQQIPDDGFRQPAVRAFEVAVLDQRHRGGLRTADVIALGVDRIDQVDQLIHIAEQRLRLARRRQHLRDPEHDPGDRRRQHNRREQTDLCLRQLRPVERQRCYQQRNGEPDARDRAAAGDPGPADQRTDPATAEPGQRDEVTITANGLPTTYPRMIPSVIGDRNARERKSMSIVTPALARPKSGTIR